MAAGQHPSSGNCQFNTSEDTQRPTRTGAHSAGKASLQDAGGRERVWEGEVGVGGLGTHWRALTPSCNFPPHSLLSNPISLITIEIQRCLKHTKEKKKTLDAFVYSIFPFLSKVTIKNGSKHQDENRRNKH